MERRGRRIRLGIALALACGAAVPVAAPYTAPAMDVDDTGALRPGPWVMDEDSSGRYERVALDPGAGRLLACHAGDGTLDVVDMVHCGILAKLAVGPVSDAVIDADARIYYASLCAGRGVVVIDARTLGTVRTLVMPGDAGIMAVDTGRRILCVAGDGDRAVWLVDTRLGRVRATVALPGMPAGLAIDAASGRLFVALADTGQVAVVDTAAGSVTALWPAAPVLTPQALALDARGGRLFCAGAEGLLVAMDLLSGRCLGSAAVPRACGQIAFDPGPDPRAGRLYCAGVDALAVVQASGGRLSSLGRIFTTGTARAVAVDGRTHAVWMAFTDAEDGYIRSWLPVE